MGGLRVGLHAEVQAGARSSDFRHLACGIGLGAAAGRLGDVGDWQPSIGRAEGCRLHRRSAFCLEHRIGKLLGASATEGGAYGSCLRAAWICRGAASGGRLGIDLRRCQSISRSF